ncbi:MAG: indole-3-glycerol phosphate synthase TrpC [Candidatus Margulisiibacteriota bacterium]
MNNILAQIITDKQKEVSAIPKQTGNNVPVYPIRDFFSVLKKGSAPRIISEVKKASPSKGVIRHDFDPVAIAREFEANRAAAISVLTDEKYFQGKLEYLTAIKQAVSIPVLRKDFIISKAQIFQSYQAGADAILLIVKALLYISDNRADRALLILSHFQEIARDLGMHCLVEVHNATELKIAVTSGARIIGVNNRDLDTFEVDINKTYELAQLLPTGWQTNNCLVSESGMFSKEDIPVCADAVLIGEGLAKNPGSFWG